MRSILLICVVMLAILVSSSCWAADYESRFVRNYPPGFYGMWYDAQRFFTELIPGQRTERYRWDALMSRETNIAFPFYPIPYDWDYGTGRTFSLPDYNANDWR
ncbi:MAG TPA: hypothetical protein VK463_03535 [Desulfomonilaceae bacterium]|nr:hypothetical protein [Desulfomonilaceae bacterium]